MPRAVRTLATGLHFGEGPRWRHDRLWFSDFYKHSICSVDLAGDLQVELELDDQPSGLGWMPDGSLLFVSMQKLQVWRRWPDGRLAMHADLSEIAVHRCNDMVVAADGTAYVGNFGFDLDRVAREQGLGAIFAAPRLAALARIAPDGTAAVAAEGLAFPNGMVITPDGRTLVVAETFGMRLTAFDIAADGSLSNRRLWADTAPRLPDGIALDAEGAIWIANPGAAECARIAQGGEVRETIGVEGTNVYACMLGGPEGRHLFMLCGPHSDAQKAAEAPLADIRVVEVDVARAGLP
ncbi:SMP-30/gluconolactonase/LRE family protein [Novosphingobium huizhouense]|uniref:SMP-30/gluconolactonase/LRE family protein n=1 Tax=Novosphingobium huizhouense TaxID=2866625 RepID=UPI001CD86256|nr:SMP-30/gluconolactonase/LRE family protein [Novosphingobium huizhouense]